MRTDATDEADLRAAMAEAQATGPLRISVDTHGGPAIGGRLLGKDGERWAWTASVRRSSTT